MESNNRLIKVVSQAFYGNRTGTEILPREMDRFVLGILDDKSPLYKDQKIDRSVIKLPETDNVVLIYNKYEEERRLKEREEYLREGYNVKPLAAIPELGIVLYSRCVACRMDQDGTLRSLEKGDYEILWKYLAP